MGAAVLCTIIALALAVPAARGQDLTASVIISPVGEATGDDAGRAVALAGDVNNDGWDDVISGARDAGPNGEGRAYIYFGGPGADNTADVVITGENAGDDFGYSVSGIGNLNGDDYDDFMVSDPLNGAGVVYIFYGEAYAGAPVNLTFADADVVITGAVSGNQFGFSVANAGDFNNDGSDDILVGASFYNGSRGRVYLFLGSTTLPAAIAAADADLIVDGDALTSGDELGYSVDSAGNVNGDDYDDIICSALDAGSFGQAYIVYGYDLTTPATVAAGDADVVLNGVVSRMGWCVAAAGNVNGDAYDDVILGDLLGDEAYVVFGSATLDAASPIDLDSADIVLTGEVAADRFGVSVARAGDLDGDGYDDFMVAGTRNDIDGNDSGRLYVFRGAASPPATIAAADADLILSGAAAGDLHGWFSASAGYFDNDANLDLVVGAPGHSGATGRTFVYAITLSDALPVPTLAAEPTFTAGTANTVSWSDESGGGATEYEAERADDIDFTTNVVSSGVTTELSYEFTGLTDGQIYYYRVRSGDGVDVSDWSDPPESSTQDDTPPETAAGPLADTQISDSFDVPWSGSDATSSVVSVDLFYQVNAGGYSNYGTFTTSPIAFTGIGDGVYDFYTIGVDEVGNVEAVPGAPDATTTVTTAIGGVTLATTPADGIFGCGETVAVDLLIDDTVVELQNWNVTITYDEALFAPDAVVLGPLTSTCDPTFLDVDTDTPGTVVVAASMLDCSVTGPGSILTFTFAGVTNGSGDVTPTEVDFRFLDDPTPNLVDVEPVSITYECIGGPPQVTTPEDQASYEGEVISLQIVATDPDEDPLTYGAIGLPPDLTIDPDTGLITGTIGCDAADASPYSVTVSVDDGNHPPVEASFGWTVVPAPPAVANLTADQVVAGNDDDGTTGITLSWDPVAADLAVEVYRKGFGNYPEYDDPPDAGSVPTTPASPAAALADGWTLTAVTSPGGVDETTTRDFWYFVAFAVSTCDVSGPSNQTEGTLNYHLGDISGGPLDEGDNIVDIPNDIIDLSLTYGLCEGDDGYLAKADVGPTTTTFTSGRPTTDNCIDFEDLILFGINFGNVSVPNAPDAENRNLISLRIGEDPDDPDQVVAGLWMTGDGTMQGVSVCLAWDETVVGPPTYELGGFMNTQGGNVLVLNPDSGIVDGTLLGRRAVGIAGSGWLARFHFPRLADGDPNITFEQVVARDSDNMDVTIETEIMAAPTDVPVIPTVTKLHPAYPNPFNPQTSLAFDLARNDRVRLTIYSVDGRLVTTIVDAELPAGRHQYVWQGRDQTGRAVPSGLYFMRLITSDRTEIGRMTLVR